MKKKFKKSIKNEYLYLFLFFVLVLLIHQFFNFSNDDVTFFSKVLNQYSLKDYLLFRYNNWTSRILIESILVYLSRHIYLWRFLNSLVICLLVYTINKLFLGNLTKKNILFVILIFLLYPFYQMAEAGFCATTLNYLWPFTFFLFSMLPLRNIYDDKKINKKMLPLYLLAFIFACNQEQVVCVALLISLLSFIYCLKEKKNIYYSVILFVISVSSIIFILTCPGNEVRTAAEIINCYPDYINADFFDKVYLGIVSTCSVLISNFLIIWLFSLVLWSVVLLSKKSLWIKIISWIQFVIITIISIFRVFIILKIDNFLEAYYYGIFGFFSEKGNVFNFSFMNFLVLALCLGMVLIFCVLIFSLFKENRIGILLLLLIGCISRLIMGFSPTIFESGTRTMIFLNFSLLIIILLLWKRYSYMFSKRILRLFYGCLLIFILVNYILTFIAIPLLRNI